MKNKHTCSSFYMISENKHWWTPVVSAILPFLLNPEWFDSLIRLNRTNR